MSSDVMVSKLLDYGLAGLVLLYLGRKIDAVDSTLRELCVKISK